MIAVIIESPFAGNKKRNLKYAKRCMADSLKRGEAPLASHVLYSGILNDDVPEERAKGIEAGFIWGHRAWKTIVYMDYGISIGMQEGIENAKKYKRDIEYRKIGKNPRFNWRDLFNF